MIAGNSIVLPSSVVTIVIYVILILIVISASIEIVLSFEITETNIGMVLFQMFYNINRAALRSLLTRT